MQRILKSINPYSIERVAGSANKFIHLVEEISDFYLNFIPGFKYWDMCASEAIMKSRLGLVTDARAKPLYYVPNTTNFTIEKGIIASNCLNTYEINMKRMQHSLAQTVYQLQQ